MLRKGVSEQKIYTKREESKKKHKMNAILLAKNRNMGYNYRTKQVIN